MIASDTIRVTIEQPALPRYRLAVFAELARRPGFELRVVYGSLPGLPNAEPEGFEACFVPHRSLRLPGRRMSWL